MSKRQVAKHTVLRSTHVLVLFFTVMFISFQGLAEVASAPTRESDGPAYAHIPVFDLKSNRHTLEIGLNQQTYGEPIYRNILETPVESLPPAEGVLTTFLQFLHVGDVDQAGTLYLDGKPNPNMVPILNFLKGRVMKAERVSFVESWYFGPYQHTLIQSSYPDGTSNVMALSVKVIDGKHYRVDVYDNAGEILGLWSYMAFNFKKGLVQQHESRSFEYEIKLKGPDSDKGSSADNPLTLYVDGLLHDFQEDWKKVGAAQVAHPGAQFVHHFFTAAKQGTHEEFLELVAGKEHERLEALLKEKPDHFEAYRGFYAADSIKDVFTMDLGAYVVHYYFRWSKGNEMQRIILANADGRFGLSKDLDTNIRSFVESQRVKDAIYQLWSEKKAIKSSSGHTNQDLTAEAIRAFEENLHNPDAGSTFYNSVIPRIKTEGLGEFVLQGARASNNQARLVYYVEDPTQDEKTWGTKIKTYAFGMEKKNGDWTVVSTNVTPGQGIEHWDQWLEEL